MIGIREFRVFNSCPPGRMDRTEASAYILFLEASWTAEGGRPHAVICGSKRGLSRGGLRLFYRGIEMQQGLLHGEGVHLSVDALP
jgi:hypothetical protein